MSFGFSVSDVISLIQITSKVSHGWKNACGEYSSITADLAVLRLLLRRIEQEVTSPTSVFTNNSKDLNDWTVLSNDCAASVLDLGKVIDKYKSLSTSRRRNWDRIRLGCTDLHDMQEKLVKRTSRLSAYVSILGISSQGRVENEALPSILQRIDNLAAQMRKGNTSIRTSRSAWTQYDGDDLILWREFRRDLIKCGFRGRDIKHYSPALRTYLARLHRNGMLEEEVPDQSVRQDASSSATRIDNWKVHHIDDDETDTLGAEDNAAKESSAAQVEDDVIKFCSESSISDDAPDMAEPPKTDQLIIEGSLPTNKSPPNSGSPDVKIQEHTPGMSPHVQEAPSNMTESSRSELQDGESTTPELRELFIRDHEGINSKDKPLDPATVSESIDSEDGESNVVPENSPPRKRNLAGANPGEDSQSSNLPPPPFTPPLPAPQSPDLLLAASSSPEKRGSYAIFGNIPSDGVALRSLYTNPEDNVPPREANLEFGNLLRLKQTLRQQSSKLNNSRKGENEVQRYQQKPSNDNRRKFGLLPPSPPPPPSSWTTTSLGRPPAQRHYKLSQVLFGSWVDPFGKSQNPGPPTSE